MSTYDDASLVLVPSGYKNGVVFSQKPMDANGQLTFTRASSATRVQSDGLIEKVRTNLILQSESFNDTGSWVPAAGGTGSAPVVTANNATAPNGTLTADTIVFNSGAGTTASDQSVIYQSITLGAGTYTGSFYARVTSGTGQLMFRHATGGSYTTANLTTSWQRFQSAELTAGATIFFEIGIRRGLNEPINSSVSVEIWGAQLEVSDFGATDYIATTSAAVSVGPVSGLPRLDYLNSSCPRLLLEGQRSNLVTFSENFDNAAWTKARTTLSANTLVSPDGNTNADTLVADVGTATSYFVALSTLTGTGIFTASVFAKKGNANWMYMRQGSSGGGTTLARAWFDLNNGTAGSVASGATSDIQSYGNGWYRCSMTFEVLSGGIPRPQFYISTGDGVATFDSDGTQSINLWGAQCEAGAYATSYIPTLGASVTRVADACSKTGISSLIGQTEGTLFVEVNKPFAEAGERYIAISDGTTSNRIMVAGGTGGNIRGFISTSGIGVFDFTSVQSGIGTHRIAIAYANNDVIMYIDGVQVTSSISVTIPAVGNLYIGTSDSGGVSTLNGGAAQAILFKTRLDNATLQSLTTL